MNQKRRDWAWAAFGAVIAFNVIIAGLLVAWAVSHDEHGRIEEERAIALARSLAYVAAHSPPSDVQEYIETVQRSLGDGLRGAYFLGTGAVDRFGLSTGNTYRANLNRDLIGVDPRSLEDIPRQKEIFDRTEAVLGTVDDSVIDQLADPDPAGRPNAAPYIRIVKEEAGEAEADSPPLINVTVPVVRSDREVVGVAGITVAQLSPPRHLPWLIIVVVLLIAGGTFFGFGLARERKPMMRWVVFASMITLMMVMAIGLIGWERATYNTEVGLYADEANVWLASAVDLTNDGAVDYSLRNYRDVRVYDLRDLPFEVAQASRHSSAGFAFSVTYIILGGLLIGLSGFTVRTFRHLAKSPWPYIYVIPSMLGMIVLVFGPFFFGVSLAFYERDAGRFVFVGLNHFFRILGGARESEVTFYWTLFVTVFWTFANVLIHVTVGLSLALILNDTLLRFKKFYRVILILPWAIPNYITALIWRGLFDTENGAVNQILVFFGLSGVDWLEGSFASAFTANLITNSWLGFPFMMVVSLGALQSIPNELYEAADVDGASRWQKFRTITLPLLKPALFPAIILGSIWTFNMFNIIYLVSRGGPANSTEILITEAYKAFYERHHWGYAAAYSVMIFLILLVYSSVMNRVSKATEGAFE